MNCGNCNGRHETLEQVRLCHQGEKQPTMAAPASAPYTPDPNKIVTGSCRKLSCDKTKTGTLAELSGWACSPEHEAGATAVPSSDEWIVGTKALYNEKRFEILEVLDGQVRLRTGGTGKLVPFNELQPV